MELHRRCPRSNIPALVMLLLQLSVLVSGAAVWDIEKPETRVDVKELRADEPAQVILESFTWDNSDKKPENHTLTICATTALVRDDAVSPEARVSTTELEGGSVMLYGVISPYNKMCAEFISKDNPFTDTDKTFALVAFDNADPTGTVKSGDATFSVTDVAGAQDSIIETCGPDYPTFFRTTDTTATGCIEGTIGFDEFICYTEIEPASITGCQDVENMASYPPGQTVEVCQPPPADSITDVEDLSDLTVGLIYDDTGTVEFSYTSTILQSTIWETIIPTGGGTYTVYRSGTSTGLLPSNNLYDMCVVGIDSDGETAVTADIGKIQDINLNLYVTTSSLLEYGFSNQNDGGKYTIFVKDEELDDITTIMDCSGVDPGNVCFGILDITDGTPGTLSVKFLDGDDGETNEIVAPYLQLS